MVDRYLSQKFGVNPLDGFWENDVYERTTDVAHVMTVALLCSITKQSKKIKEIFFFFKLPLPIVQEKPQMKFGRNPCIRFRDNCDTDDGQWTNFDFMSSADIVKQS